MSASAHRLHVLHVTQPVTGGVAAYVVAACRDQRDRDWDVSVACPDAGDLPRALEREGVPRWSWAAHRAPLSGAANETASLHRVLADVRPEVVHLHAAKAGLVGRILVRGQLPTLFQPHGWSWLAVDGPLLTAAVGWERTAARWTSRFICVGQDEARAGRAMGVRGSFTVVRNGVDLRRFTPAGQEARASARVALDLPQDGPLAVCVGRITRQKGQDVLLAAWPRVRQLCPDAQLALVGDGDGLPALRARAGPGVRFAGAQADVRPWLAAADLVVLPSRWEGLPLTALEAFASGRPVVASAVPGLTEVLPPAVGASVAPEDPVALAEAVASRLRDPALLQSEGRAARAWATRFDLQQTLDALATVTEVVLRSPRPRGLHPVTGGPR